MGKGVCTGGGGDVLIIVVYGTLMGWRWSSWPKQSGIMIKNVDRGATLLKFEPWFHRSDWVILSHLLNLFVAQFHL